MKNRIMLILFAVLLVFTLVGAPVLAKDPDNEAQGQPFQELRDAIDEAIAQMEQLIGEVQEELEELISEVELGVEQMIEDAILALEGQLAELQEQLNDEEAARVAADQQLQNNLDAEEAARIAADNAEAAARQNADNQLQNNINTEETARIAADQALQSQIPDGHSLDAADGSPVDVVYVDNAGEVGIGTSNPSHKLQVAGSVRADDGFYKGGSPYGVTNLYYEHYQVDYTIDPDATLRGMITITPPPNREVISAGASVRKAGATMWHPWGASQRVTLDKTYIYWWATNTESETKTFNINASWITVKKNSIAFSETGPSASASSTGKSGVSEVTTFEGESQPDE